jgi:carboxyl-terminal processing protease
VRLTGFTRTTSADLDKAIEEIRKAGAAGLILDLRYNLGGLLNAATEVVSKFVDKGVIVSTRPDRPDSPNLPSELSVTNSGGVKLPLIVLVNQSSASASEIVAGALKDHNRAMSLGERTFGKGLVQVTYPVGNQQAALKLTISHYYLPSGKCIHREENSKEWGVDPNVTIEMTPDQMRAAMDAQRELDVLRDPDAPPDALTPEKADGSARPGGKENGTRKDPLSVDAQLSAALLLMRLQLTGGDQLWVQAQSAPSATPTP